MSKATLLDRNPKASEEVSAAAREGMRGRPCSVLSLGDKSGAIDHETEGDHQLIRGHVHKRYYTAHCTANFILPSGEGYWIGISCGAVGRWYHRHLFRLMFAVMEIQTERTLIESCS